MDFHFGFKVKQSLERLDAEVIKRVSTSRHLYASEEFIAMFGHFEGCTEEEIEALKQYQQVHYVPKIYQQFLEVAGHKSGGILFKGADANYECLKWLKAAAKTVLDECSDDHLLFLPEDAFVFLMYQSSEFSFFLTGEQQENPPVYNYHQCDEKFNKVAEHLSEWFEMRITEITKMVDEEFK